ncbi:MAG: DUF262 domain-containing protein [Rickettsiales bacterium]|jgi:hypothetical protein|nr:DUF262 domain-containing protein [Rickettsiales bacterium]
MEIKLHPITLRSLFKDYKNNEEEGVVGFDGKLNIRPKYQREFVYNNKQRDGVIDSVRKKFPLNVMYWSENEDGTFEVLDGQQRTISICEYIDGNFSINNMAFHNLTDDQQKQILDYELMVYFCSGTNSEKLDWFKVINIAGEELTSQELLNAVYTGEWLTDAKRFFSKTGCVAAKLGGEYVKGKAIRQEILETAIDWISDGKIEAYMSEHQHDPDAGSLWLYFQNVINWTKVVFPNYRKEMKGVDWGQLYNKYGQKSFNVAKLESEVSRLMLDDDVTKKSGIYPFVLGDGEKWLSIRAFTLNQKREAYEKQAGICPKCTKHFEIDEMEADHITPWHAGGKTTAENCQMLCKECNRRKSGI